jgi:hypothetical protein
MAPADTQQIATQSATRITVSLQLPASGLSSLGIDRSTGSFSAVNPTAQAARLDDLSAQTQ